MAGPKFKQKCAMCKTNWVEMFSSRQFPICVECHMKRISDKITDPKYKFLNIPDEIYMKSPFLRNIKEAYLRFKSLSEKQVEVFKKIAKELKENKSPKKSPN